MCSRAMREQLVMSRALKLRRALPVLLFIVVAVLYFVARASCPESTFSLRRPSDAASLRAREPRRGPSTSPVAGVASPASAAQRVPSSVSGRVQTARGIALAGARVCVAAPSSRWASACTSSDRRGEFLLEFASDLPVSLFAFHPGYVPASRDAAASSTAIVVTLEEGGAAITGTVLDAEGGPITGAEVRASDLGELRVALGVSDAAGRFRLDAAPGATRLHARADGYAEQLRHVLAPLDGIELELVAAASIVGRAVAEDTLAPVAGVLVSAVSADGFGSEHGEARTGEDGTFRLRGSRPGRYSLGAVGDTWRSDEYTVVLGLAQDTEPLLLTLHRATELTGVVRLGGAPCTQGAVLLEGPIRGYARPGPSGKVAFAGITPGQYQLSVTCQGASRAESLSIGLEHVQREWDLEAGLRVAGTVLSARGAPVAGAQVIVEASSPASGTYCMTDDRGVFSCGGLAPGDYDVRLVSNVSARADVVRVHLATGPSPPIVLQAHPEGSILVRIDSPRPIDPATLSVTARGPDGRALHGETWDDRVVFDPVALGGYEVFDESDPSADAVHVELTRAEEAAEIVLRKSAPDSLHGQVVDEQGQIVPDAWVEASGEHGLARALCTAPVLTDRDGAFAIDGLVPGRYTLRAHSGRGQGYLASVASNRSDAVVRVQTDGSLSGASRSAEPSVALEQKPPD